MLANEVTGTQAPTIRIDSDQGILGEWLTTTANRCTGEIAFRMRRRPAVFFRLFVKLCLAQDHQVTGSFIRHGRIQSKNSAIIGVLIARGKAIAARRVRRGLWEEYASHVTAA